MPMSAVVPTGDVRSFLSNLIFGTPVNPAAICAAQLTRSPLTSLGERDIFH
jgi:hypothetical protein